MRPHPPAARGTPPAVRRLFVAAFLALLALEGWLVMRMLVRLEEVSRLFYGHRFVLGPVVTVLILLWCWFGLFRDEREGTRVCALAASAAIVLFWIVMLLNQGVLSTVPLPFVLGYPLIAAVFALYGVRAVERRR